MPRHPRATMWRLFSVLIALLLIPQSLVGGAPPLVPDADTLIGGPDTPVLLPGRDRPDLDEEEEERLLELDFAIVSRRLAGDRPLSLEEAASLRVAAARQAALIRNQGIVATSPVTFGGAWSAVGPNPIGEITRSTSSLVSMNGRTQELLIHPDGYFILGGAQGGIWVFNGASWSPKTDNLPSLAIGALALAPSDSDIVYAGTGEGALSGDSYFGNGVLKSTDGGMTWSHVSGDDLVGVSISRIVVDPDDEDHLYAAVLRGRGGARRVSPPLHSKYGIWESNNGGADWTLLMQTPKNTLGATDLEMDPQDPDILYASFWGDMIYKSTDGGDHWATAMTGLPTLYNSFNLTRWSIGLSHPAAEDPVLYVGSDIIDDNGDYQQSRLWRSDDEAASWQELPTTGFTGSDDSVLDYCGGQCFYDNEVQVDPSDTDIVYAGGQFNYSIGSGGIFRSDDGGQTWKNLGWDLHPDYHAFAFGPDPDEILVGSDGGVWWSGDRGGRLPGALDEGDISAVDWFSLNGYGLQIAQFTSVATNPSFTGRERMWGGTQDNGTMRKSAVSQTWFDMYSGDGGQVLVDPNDWHYVYGTYFGVSPYRDVNGGSFFFTNQFITGGINLSDRSDFYIPWVMNKENTNQLFLGTYRLYRTDNAKAASAGDVLWKPISPDLTSGCTGTAPNGARNCTISAIGIGGGTAVYTGSLDGLVYLSTDAKVNPSPSWTRLDQNGLPKRPVTQFAVDRSDYRTAYVSYAGFSPGTPGRPGHVYKTSDGGKSWADISGNLPDSPVNSIILDPSYPDTLYAGTDVGPFVTYDGGAHWNALGTGFPVVAIWQLDLDTGVPAGANAAGPRTLLAGTHGRGAFRMTESLFTPALMVSKVDAGVPVGPSSDVTYTLTVKNIGNADATGVSVTDPLPANTSFVSVADGGVFAAGKVTWSGLTLAAGASTSLHFTVSVAPALKKQVKSIVNDGIVVSSAEGPGATGSPTVTPIAPPYAVSISPASQTDGAQAGDSVTYPLTIKNLAFNTDTFSLASSGGTYTVDFFQADCTTPLVSVGPLSAGASSDVCVEVDVPGGASNGDLNIATVTATSAGNPAVSASATIKTIAVTFDVLLVDNDGNGPNVQSYYSAALTGAGVTSFNVWDLSVDPNIPLGYMQAHATVVWFTGNAYPGPLLPYEDRLAAYLDGGGHLFMSGHDILDQAAGTTDFVFDYLHINWDGTETQNDKSTDNVHAVALTLSDGVGTVPIDHSILGAAFEDRLTLVAPAVGIFTDDSTAYDALSVDTLTYKVVFLAFPFEAYGSAAQKIDLMTRILAYLGP